MNKQRSRDLSLSFHFIDVRCVVEKNVSVREAAARVGVGYSTMLGLVHAGTVIRPGLKLVYRLIDDLPSFLSGVHLAQPA